MTLLRLTRNPDVLTQEFENETILVVPLRQETQVLNEVAARVWDLCEGRSVEAIVEVVVEEYDASADRIEADVRALIEQMLADGLVSAHH